MIVFGIQCNFFIALPNQLKLFLERKIWAPEKPGASQRFCAPDADRARNLSRPETVLYVCQMLKATEAVSKRSFS